MMKTLLFSNLLLAYSQFSCDESFCLPSMRSDGNCDSVCMTSVCNFDSSISLTPTTFYYSDCYTACFLSACDLSHLGDSICDPSCNNFQCGWDFGDCGFCNEGCSLPMLTNSICDAQCSTASCMFDNNECGWCAPDCFKEDLSDSICNPSCNNLQCAFDNGACVTSALCSLGCYAEIIGNGICDSQCNVDLCGYDGDDCSCNPGCDSEVRSESSCRRDLDGKVIDPCAVWECGFKDGKCGDCGIGCFSSMLGNGNCDSQCFNQGCFYDQGDCQCAPGCLSTYNAISESFTFVGGCNPNCLVAGCFYNGDACDDPFLTKAALINQIAHGDWTKVLDLSACTGACNETDLRACDSGSMCEVGSSCDTLECLYCDGMVNTGVGSCVRMNDTQCMICDTMMVMDKCQEIGDCPIGYIQDNYLQSMLGTKFCLKEPIDSDNLYQQLYVDPRRKKTAGDLGIGTLEDPYGTLFSALVSITSDFAKVILRPTDHIFEPDIGNTLTNPNDPLKGNPPRHKLFIMGEDPDNRPTVYWRGNMKLSPGTAKVYFLNIDFKGVKILKSCAEEYCLYCPYVYTDGILLYDDNGNEINSDLYMSHYGKTCGDYNNEVLFTFSGEVFMENVNFYGFRHQFKSLIQSEKSLYMNKVSFVKIQPIGNSSVIELKCLDNCEASTFHYISGTVQDLNSGYQLLKNTEQSSFVYIENYNGLTVKDVNFQYNVVFSNKLYTENKSLFYVKNNKGILQITNCMFDNIIANYLVYYDISSLTPSDYFPNFMNYLTTDLIQLEFSRLQISNTYCTESCIYYYTITLNENVNLNSITIIESLVHHSFIRIQGSKFQGVSIVNNYSSTLIPVKILSLTAISITSSFTGVSAIQTFNYEMALISSLILSIIADISLAFISRILQNFKDTSRYLSLISSATGKSCSQLLLLGKLSIVSLEDIQISEISCNNPYSTYGIFTSSIIDLSLNNFNLLSCTGSSSNALGLDISNSANLKITNLMISDISNKISSVLSIRSCSFVSIENASIMNIASSINSPIQLFLLTSLMINSISITSSTTSFGNGGCLSILLPSSGSTIQLTSLTFDTCVASNRLGGGIYLNSEIPNNPSSLHIDTWTISNSRAFEGSVLFIEELTMLNETSLISNLVAVSNTGLKSTITDLHRSGLLTFDTVSCYANTADSGVFRFQYAPGLMLSMKNLIFSGNYYFECLFKLTSRNSTSIMSISSLETQDSTLIFKVFGFSLSANNIQAFYINSFLYAHKSAIVTIKDANMIMSMMSAVVINGGSLLNCTACTFSYPLKDLFVVNMNGWLILNKCNVGQCFGQFGYVLITENQCLIQISETIISDCTISLESLKVFKSIVKIENSKISSTSAFMIIGTNFQIINTEINGMQGSLTSPIISIESESVLTFKDSSLAYCSGYSLGLIKVSSSEIYFQNATLANNSVVANGIINIKSSKLIASGIVFESNYASSMDTNTFQAKDSVVSISKCQFFNKINVLKSKSIISLSNSDFSLYSSSFKDLNFSQFLISASYSTGFLIDSSVFSNNSCSSVVFLESSRCSRAVISNSQFFNNFGNLSGSIYAKDIALDIVNTVFILNNSSFMGGGINMNNSLCRNCQLRLLGSSSFINNTAELEGGAIKNVVPEVIHEDQIIFINNRAAYGSRIAGFARKLEFYTDLNDLSSDALNDSISVSPGQIFEGKIRVLLMDNNDNLVTPDNVTLLTITHDSNSSYISGSTSFKAQKGIITITGISFYGRPDSYLNIFLELKISPTNQESTFDDEFSLNSSLRFYLRPCTHGEKITMNACVMCPQGRYSIFPSESCYDCPDHATCNGGDLVIPDSGYCRSNELSSVIYKCPISEACLQGDIYHVLGVCKQGYVGLLCGSCDFGYRLDYSNECKKCESPMQDIIIIVVIALLGGFIVRKTIMVANTEDLMIGVHVKLLASHIQMIYIVSLFQLNWPNYLLIAFTIVNLPSKLFENIFSFDCVLNNSEQLTFAQLYYWKLGLMALSPAVLLLLICLLWICISFYQDNFIYIKREMFSTMILMLFFIYPNLVTVLFMNFSCKMFDYEGYYLNYTLAIKCWDEDHLKYSLALALPSIIVWVIAVPLLVFIVVHKRKNSLHTFDNSVLFGFIHSGFSKKKFYWEFIIMLRKILLIAITASVSFVSIPSQSLTATIALTLLYFVQFTVRPYRTKTLNRIEKASLGSVSFTIYSGLIYYDDSLGDFGNIALFIVVCIVNCYFLAVWFDNGLGIIVNYLSIKVRKIRRMCKKGDNYDQNINREEIVRPGITKNKYEPEKKEYTFMNRSLIKPDMPNGELPNDFSDFLANALAKDFEKA